MKIRRLIPVNPALLASLILILAACGSTGDGGANDRQPGPDTGSLLVTVTGLPAGVDADVTVSSPDGFNQALSATTTLTDLEPATYTVTAASVTTGAETFEPSVSDSPAAVTAGNTATVTVNYALSEDEEEEVEAGSLQVNITGLPAGVDADVSVTGPAGFTESLAASRLLADLPVGTYQVTALEVAVGTATFEAQVDPGQPEVLAETLTTVNVSYSEQPLADDGDTSIRPAVFVYFNPSGTSPYWFDEPIFNTDPILASGLQYINEVGQPGDTFDYLRFTQQPGNGPNSTMQLRLDCTLEPDATAGVRVRIYDEDDDQVAVATVCGQNRQVTIPANASHYEYLVTIEAYGTSPSRIPYVLTMNSHCFQQCNFQPYVPTP